MKFENTQVFNFEGAFRGLRNPLASWNRSDSKWHEPMYWSDRDTEPYGYEDLIGEKDMELAQKLIIGGSEHRKFMRQIIVSVDITAPEYYWSQFDTYKVGTVANSTSKMHKLASTPITLECFELDDHRPDIVDVSGFIQLLEDMRQAYLTTKNQAVWKEIVRWLPESWLQKRTVTMNYENVRSMVHQRAHHKLSEWNQFVEWAHTLPYANELIFYDGEAKE